MTTALATALLMWSVMLPGIAGAAEDDLRSCTTTDNVTTCTDLDDSSSFDVSEILTVEGDSTTGETGQTQKYFEDSEAPIVSFILDIINFITQIIGAIAMILIILGGLMMIVSEGDENRLQRGKTILTDAIIGLIIAMFSYIIVRFVQSLFYLQQ